MTVFSTKKSSHILAKKLSTCRFQIQLYSCQIRNLLSFGETKIGHIYRNQETWINYDLLFWSYLPHRQFVFTIYLSYQTIKIHQNLCAWYVMVCHSKIWTAKSNRDNLFRIVIDLQFFACAVHIGIPEH